MRIGIVNDLKLAVEILIRIVQSRPNLSVAWVAKDGQEAVDFTLRDLPDLILMDLVMPNKNGLEATIEIMRKKPCPILIVSSKLSPCMNMVFETMGAGALDVIATPSIQENGSIFGAEDLLNKIDNIANVTKKQRIKVTKTVKEPTKCPFLVALGASTGGPSALVQLLKNLRQPLNASIVIIQHVDKEFLSGFCRWLYEQTNLDIDIAEGYESPVEGKVYIANTDKNLTINEEREFYYPPEKATINIPSVDTFFESLALNWPTLGVASLLTGMGSDGAKGLVKLKNKGWTTMVQNEQSCVVFGMPKKAIELDPSIKTFTLVEIAQAINNLFKKDGVYIS